MPPSVPSPEQAVHPQPPKKFTIVVQAEGIHPDIDSGDFFREISAAGGAITLGSVKVEITDPKLEEDEIILRRIAEGLESYGLTRQERRVVELLIRGFTYVDAAQEMSLAPGTVRNYASYAIQKTGAGTKSGLACALLGLI